MRFAGVKVWGVVKYKKWENTLSICLLSGGVDKKYLHVMKRSRHMQNDNDIIPSV